MMWTARDEELLMVLNHRVRIATMDQAGRTWWPQSRNAKADAAARIRLLAKAGFVSTYQAVAHPELPLEHPVATWRPGEEAPELGAVSYRLKQRWREPPQLMTFVIASAKSRSVFGGHGGRRPREVDD